MLDKIWNNRLYGIFPAVVLLCSIAWDKILNKVSTILFRLNVNRCGKSANIMRGVTVRYPGLISAGNSLVIGRATSISTEMIDSNKLIIGDDVSIGNHCSLDFTGGITICNESHIAHNVKIITHDHGYDYKSKPIGKSLSIGRHVFIGSNSTILFNCNHIGDYAVIGVGSVVTKDIPEKVVVAGNPAKIIKYIQ